MDFESTNLPNSVVIALVIATSSAPTACTWSLFSGWWAPLANGENESQVALTFGSENECSSHV